MSNADGGLGNLHYDFQAVLIADYMICTIHTEGGSVCLNEGADIALAI